MTVIKLADHSVPLADTVMDASMSLRGLGMAADIIVNRLMGKPTTSGLPDRSLTALRAVLNEMEGYHHRLYSLSRED